MNNKIVIVIVISSLLIGGAVGFGLCNFNLLQRSQQPTSSPAESLAPQETTPLQQTLKDYEIVQAETITFAEDNKQYRVFGFASKQMGGDSFIEIFEKSSSDIKSIYKFQPVLPEDLYPNPLTFEKMWAVMEESTESAIPETTALLTSWGETGADYFGSHPIVIKPKDGSFQAVDFYKGNLSDNPKIKKSEWTTKDFEVKNFYDKGNSVKTILTQGVSLKDNKIVLRFISDNECKACQHTYAELKFSAD